MSIKQEVENFISNAESYTDAEFRKAVAAIMRLFHNHVAGEENHVSVVEAPVAKTASVATEPEPVAVPRMTEPPEPEPEKAVTIGGDESGENQHKE